MLQVADDEYEGLYTVTVEHSFNSGNCCHWFNSNFPV